MSEIECAQLHSELFRRRHCTRQSHGLFALAKHLLYDTVWCIVCPDEVGLRAITHWIVADLNTVDGRALLYSAIKQLVSSTHSLIIL